ncbi:unnamed protein product [Closterium sp. NIES-64]|nr:unnamed protein product [Closterium sp. NIES-64]
MDSSWPGSQLHQRIDGLESREKQRLRFRRPEERPETPESRPETPESRPGSGGGDGRGKQRDGKKVRMVQYPYKPLLPRDGFSWVKYGQKKLTTGDNMMRLYFQCGLRTSHACPARRTVDLSCCDPSAHLLLNYHSTHNHPPHYHAAAATTTTSPGTLPKGPSVKDRATVTKDSAAVTAGGAATAAAVDCVNSSPASKRAAVKEDATAAKAGSPASSPSCLPARCSFSLRESCA